MAVKKTRKSSAARTVRPLKQVKAKTPMTPEENLRRLSRSKLPLLFVKKHEGKWNHEDWLEFLEEIKKHGYYPINTDFVGLILEEKKERYFRSL